MANTLSRRVQSENVQLDMDYPLVRYIGPVTLLGDINGEGLQRINSFVRYISPAQATLANFFSIVSFLGGATESTQWFSGVVPGFPLAPTTISLTSDGLYLFNMMSTYSIAMGSNEEYNTELWVGLAVAGVPGPLTLVATSNVSKNNEVGNSQNVQGTWFRYLTSGSTVQVRLINTEINNVVQALSILRLAS